MGLSDRKLVLWFSPWFPSRIHSTLGNFIERHARVAGSVAHVEVIHYTSKDKGSYKVEPIKSKGISGLHIFKSPGLTGWFRLVAEITRQLFNKKPAVVHLNIFHECWWIAVLARIIIPRAAIVCSEHWTGYHNGTFEQLPWWKQKAIRRASSLVQIFLPVTNHLGHSIRVCLSRNISYQVIPNVVDEEVFTYNPESEKKFTFLHVSTLDFNHKRPDVILRAFAHLAREYPFITIALGGDGNLEPLKNLASWLGIEHLVSFFEEKSSREIAVLMQESEFMVLYSRFENFPCVIAEAWMCGVPVISSDVGGIAEWLSPETGILVNPNDENELLLGMKKAVTNTSSFNRCRIYEHALAHFSTHIVRSKFQSLYTRLYRRC